MPKDETPTHDIGDSNSGRLLVERLLVVLVDGVDAVIRAEELVHLLALAEQAHILASAPAAVRG